MRLISALILFMGYFGQASPITHETARKMYFEGWQGECGAEELVDLLRNIGLQDDAVLLAYKGAATTTLANCKINPFGKLSVFNKGREMLEAAVEKAHQNIEIRLLRYTVQSNIPGLLNYDNMEADKKFILEKLTLQPDQIDVYLRTQIINYLNQHGDLSEKEQKQILQLTADR